MKSILAVIALSFLLGGCGTSKTYMTSKAQKMQTWQICKLLLEGDVNGWQIPWYNSVLEERGENCEKYIGKFKPPEPAQVIFPTIRTEPFKPIFDLNPSPPKRSMECKTDIFDVTKCTFD